MLKNKGLTFILVGLVGYVWYQVFFRIKDNFFSEQAVVESSVTDKQFNFTIDRDTSTLSLNYRDPFLPTKNISKGDKKDYSTHIQNINTLRQEIYVEWPEIKFYGFMKNTQSKQPLIIIKLDDEFYYVRKGETILDGIMISNVTPEYLNVTYQKKSYYKIRFNRNLEYIRKLFKINLSMIRIFVAFVLFLSSSNSYAQLETDSTIIGDTTVEDFIFNDSLFSINIELDSLALYTDSIYIGKVLVEIGHPDLIKLHKVFLDIYELNHVLVHHSELTISEGTVNPNTSMANITTDFLILLEEMNVEITFLTDIYSYLSPKLYQIQVP